MKDESVTGFDDVDSAPAGQADDTTTKPAASDQTETQTDPDLAKTTTDEDFSDEDLAWAQKKGVNLEDKKAVAKMLRNADQKVSETALKAKTSLQTAVEKTTEPGADDDVVTTLMKQNRQQEARLNVMSYYIENPDDRQYDGEATALINELVVTNPELALGLSRDLPSLIALAKQRHSGSDVAKAKEEGRKEERTALAGKQRASATRQAATTSVTSDETEFDQAFLKGFDKK
jgi:uncharacterized membrane protein